MFSLTGSGSRERTSVNETHGEGAQRAISAGKDICELLADILRQSPLANNGESNLSHILTLADELLNYQSPVEFKIGLVGDSGVGKSSLINSLLDVKSLAKTGGNARACTSIVTEYRRKRASDSAAFTIEIDCLDNQEIEELLHQIIVDYRRYHARSSSSLQDEEGDELRQLRVKAQWAWDTLKAVFEDQCTEEAYFKNPNIEINELHRLVQGWKTTLDWPAEFNNRGATLTAVNPAECEAKIERYLKPWMWPFIKTTRIYLNAPVLQSGIVLVDLPGFRDVNTARIKVTEQRLYQCDEIFIVTPIIRADADASVENVMIRQLGRNFSSLRRSQGVTIICTKSEDLQEFEVLRDVPNVNLGDVEDLDKQIEEAMENGQPTNLLDARRKHLFVFARNEYVGALLRRHYGDRVNGREINFFCVSNALYLDARRQQVPSRNISLLSTDREKAAQKMLKTSGILELRQFIIRIPELSQIDEAQRFLGTKLQTLFDKTEFWLAASLSSASNRQTTREILEVVKMELKDGFDHLAESTHDGMIHAKIDLLQAQFTSMGIWERYALSAVENWEGWFAATWAAFWNHEGAHSTPSVGEYRDWNSEILEAMVNDFRDKEAAFREQCGRQFTSFKSSAHRVLSVLPERLAGWHGVEVFDRTLPRRRREIDYDVDRITALFDGELQNIFHDLLNTHSTSYVMRHFKPMYNETYSGPGLRKRLIKRFKLQITGDRVIANLFREIRRDFTTSTDYLIMEAAEMLKGASDRCLEQVGSDFELLHGEAAHASPDNGALDQLFHILEGARSRRDIAKRELGVYSNNIM
ncbi:hypothetical protein AJ80_01594 [Polytolypa hystricis UAMH7299]|uniref:G domain-containing protein n=1 Tax=Polytolypa hystricis (strain UAMH7299) TaxID=1447883 RepID=A0A2B7Z085_POLH7|nr:hypothetical protein AJ80_01594 [Polytolypa hystricis UAMH7299]